MKDPLPYLLKTLLRANKISINGEELEFQLLSHPTYPSLHAVTGVLDHFAVKNFALEIPRSLEALSLLPSCFLAFVKDDKHNGLVHVSRLAQGYRVSFDDKQKEIYSIDTLLEIWTGIAVIIDEENQKVVSEGKPRYFTDRNILITTMALLAILFLYRASPFPAIHFLLSLAGLAMCVLILYHELGVSSGMLSRFCSEQGEKTSCDAVLNSKGANLLGAFKLSDVGIIYFVSLALSWNLLRISSAGYTPIALITLLALPFTLYSVYYQLKVVKKWCLLCLSVVSILWLQAASLLFSDLKMSGISLDLNSAATTASCFLASFALWQFIAPRLKKEQELNGLKVEHHKFKRNYSIFKTLIGRSARISTSISDPNEIVYCSGEGTPPLSIVLITNPLCGFCKETHELTEKLLAVKGKSISITLRFSVKDDFSAVDTRIAQRLIEVYHSGGDRICLNALRDIYGEMVPDDWLLKWGEPCEPKYRSVLMGEKEWCAQHGINFTPEILVNGRSFPREYSRADLLLFVDDLTEDGDSIETPELNAVAQEI